MQKQVSEIRGQMLATLEQCAIASVLMNEFGHVLHFNRAAEQLWGVDRSQILGKHVATLVPTIFHGVICSFFHGSESTRQEIIDNRRYRVQRLDGGWLWIFLAMSRIASEGEVIYHALMRDVSDEMARRDESRLLRMAFNHSGGALAICDPMRRLLHVNDAFARLYGYAASDLIGQDPCTLLTSPSLAEEDLRKLCSLPWGREHVQVETLARHRNGSDRWLRINSVPIQDDRALSGYFVDSIYDITEERLIRDLERDFLEAINSSLPFQELGDFLCRRIASIVPDVTPSLMLVDESCKFRPWAVGMLPADYREALDGLPIGEGVGSCGTAAARGVPVISTDINSDPLWAPYVELRAMLGMSACWSYPILDRDGAVSGAFALYVSHRASPTAFHHRILEICTHLCALALEMERGRQRMEQLIQFDRLTGLPNREQLYRHASNTLLHGPTRGMTMMVIDIDRFGQINDTLGHPAGDEVLVELANRMRTELSASEFLSRLGGDVFVIVIADRDSAYASRLAQKIREIIAAPVHQGGRVLELKISIGISHSLDRMDDVEVLLAGAKATIARLKRAGGNAIDFFNAALSQDVQNRLRLSEALERAIKQERLQLVYQPQVNPETGVLYGVEALARWHDDEFGDVPPGQFVALAEENGQIAAIGRWALRSACNQMAQWREAGLSVPVVSVNLSPMNFRDVELPALLAQLLKEYDVQGHSLTIEVTESTMLAFTPEMSKTVAEVRKLGVGLSVDDFGTGFSCLSNLLNLPVTEVKIDRSFVADCESHGRAQSLVSALIGIGESLGLVVVAEGVETTSQLGWLSGHHCPVVQGYFVSRPLTASGLEAWLVSR